MSQQVTTTRSAPPKQEASGGFKSIQRPSIGGAEEELDSAEEDAEVEALLEALSEVLEGAEEINRQQRRRDRRNRQDHYEGGFCVC